MSAERIISYTGDAEREYFPLKRKRIEVSMEATGTPIREVEKESSKRVVLIEVPGEQGTTYRPELVNRKAESDISEFIITETKRSKQELHELRTIDPMGAHGRRRSIKLINDIRKQREAKIRQEKLEEKLAVLKSESIQPIKLIKENDKIVGFKLADFASDEQKRWWTFLGLKDHLVRVAELAKVFPEGQELLEEVFSIRYKSAYGWPEEMDKAKKDLLEFQKRLREVPRDHDTLLVPLFRMITEHFGN